MIDFLDWVARAGGIIAILMIALGYVFREKWKQMLQRSLAEDLERLKSELSKSQMEHAASLTPQLEQIKHDFQQKLEAYKVSLIAQAEAAKAHGELRKTIALRYAEIEFERLVELERVMAVICVKIFGMAGVGPPSKRIDDHREANELLIELRTALVAAEMFLSPEVRLAIVDCRGYLLDVVGDYVGPGKLGLTVDSEIWTKVRVEATKAETALRNRIRELGEL